MSIDGMMFDRKRRCYSTHDEHQEEEARLYIYIYIEKGIKRDIERIENRDLALSNMQARSSRDNRNTHTGIWSRTAWPICQFAAGVM